MATGLAQPLVTEVPASEDGEDASKIGLAEAKGPTLAFPSLLDHQLSHRFQSMVGLRKGSLRAAVYNLFSSVLGAGVLGLPYTTQRFGAGVGIPLTCAFAMASIYTLRLLEWTAQLTGVRGYRQLAEHTLGEGARPLVSLAIFCNTFGSLVVYLLVIGDILSGFALVWAGSQDGELPPGASRTAAILANPVHIIIAVGATVCLPLSLTKDLSALRYTSLMSLASIVFLALCLVLRAGEQTADGGAQGWRALGAMLVRGPSVGFAQLLGSLPSFIYAFSCHFNYFSAVRAAPRLRARRPARHCDRVSPLAGHRWTRWPGPRPCAPCACRRRPWPCR